MDTMNCIATACTPIFCSHHKEEQFQCAQEGCSNNVEAQVIYAGSKYLDAGYADRTVLGVKVDSHIYQRPPQVSKTVTKRNIGDATKTNLRMEPRTKKETHQYLCQACSAKIVITLMGHASHKK